MKKLFVLCAAALLAASAAGAAEEEQGRITSIDPTDNTFTIETDDGDRITYRTESGTRIMRDGSTVQLRDLTVGSRVEVTAPEAEGETQRVAREISLMSGAGTAGSAGTGGEATTGTRTGAGTGADVSAGADVRTPVGDAGVGAEAGARVGETEAEAEARMAQADDPAMRGGAEADVDVDVDDDRMAQAGRLPSTASPLPLIGLLGAASLVAGLMLRGFRR